MIQASWSTWHDAASLEDTAPQLALLSDKLRLNPMHYMVEALKGLKTAPGFCPALPVEGHAAALLMVAMEQIGSGGQQLLIQRTFQHLEWIVCQREEAGTSITNLDLATVVRGSWIQVAEHIRATTQPDSLIPHRQQWLNAAIMLTHACQMIPQSFWLGLVDKALTLAPAEAQIESKQNDPIQGQSAGSTVGYHVTGMKNLPSILQKGLAPGIGVRSSMLQERLPAVYLFSDVESCHDAVVNWLGAVLDEEEEIAILEVDLAGVETNSPWGGELVVHEALPVDRIRAVLNEQNLRDRTDVQNRASSRPT